MTPVLEVIAPGLLTTVQDRGRHCYQALVCRWPGP